MSISLRLRQLYHLISNPFDPPRADLREPEKIIIIGENHREALDTIVSSLAESTESRLLILRGDWGTGKTAVIRRAIYELEERIGEKLFTLYYRIPRSGYDLNEFVLHMVIEAYSKALEKDIKLDDRIKSVVESWNQKLKELEELTEEKSKTMPILLNILQEVAKQGRKILIVMDQLENLHVPKKDDEAFPTFLRDLFDHVSKFGQVVVVLSAIKYKLDKMFSEDIWSRFVRAGTEIMDLGKLSVDDTIFLFKTLLEKYHEPEYRDRYKETRSLEPFTADAIREIWRLANGIPGRIYDIAFNVIVNAAKKGIERIDLTTVRYLAGEYDFKWIDAIERMPYIGVHDLISSILEASRKLLDVIYVRTDIITKDNYSSFLKLKSSIKDEELEKLLNSWRKGANFLVYSQVDGRYKLSIVKVSEKMIRRDVIEHLHYALTLSVPLLMERPIAPIDTSIILITAGRVTAQASYKARGLEVAFGIRVKEKIIDTSEPKSYGRLRALVEEIKELEDIYGDLYSAPPEDLEKLKEELQSILRSLGIIF